MGCGTADYCTGRAFPGGWADADKMPIYELGEFGVIFKHPYFRDPQKFSDWDCGHIMGSILTMKDLQQMQKIRYK